MNEPGHRPAGRNARPQSERSDRSGFHKSAVDFLLRLHVVIKNAKIYEPNNEMVVEQSGLLLEALEPFMQADGQASLRVRQSSLFLNGTRLKPFFSTYAVFKSILDEFRVRDLSALTLLPGIDGEELVRFSVALGRQDKAVEEPFEKLLADLAAGSVEHVDVEKASVTETFTSLHKDTARIFFLSILHLKESFEREQRGDQIKITTTRRLMQSIFNHIVDNESFVYGLTNLKNYDEYTLNHSANVCMLSLSLGRRLGLSRGELVDLGIATFFHDLGKLETPLDILNKPAKLNEAEREVMEFHPHQGAAKLIRLKEFKQVPLRAIHVALEHHIREDAAGYPRCFKRKGTNLFSKIVKVVDFFDAVTTKRVYRKKVFTRAEALSLMLESIGTEFNPMVLKTFVQLMGLFPVGTMVALDTKELAIVFEANPDPQFLLRPRVKLITDAEGNRVDGPLVDLSDRNPETNRFQRTILEDVNPETYGIDPSEYFLALAQ
jgi:HD-GYP domain-containing protein (c-di-GMP phosphodiesterase class II)